MAGGEEKLEEDTGSKEDTHTHTHTTQSKERQECEEETTKPKWKVSRDHIMKSGNKSKKQSSKCKRLNFSVKIKDREIGFFFKSSYRLFAREI